MGCSGCRGDAVQALPGRQDRKRFPDNRPQLYSPTVLGGVGGRQNPASTARRSATNTSIYSPLVIGPSNTVAEESSSFPRTSLGAAQFAPNIDISFSSGSDVIVPRGVIGKIFRWIKGIFTKQDGPSDSVLDVDEPAETEPEEEDERDWSDETGGGTTPTGGRDDLPDESEDCVEVEVTCSYDAYFPWDLIPGLGIPKPGARPSQTTTRQITQTCCRELDQWTCVPEGCPDLSGSVLV